MDYAILLVDGMGILCFGISAYYAYKNNNFIKEASSLWLYFGSASLMAILWTLSFILRQFFSLPEIIESSLFFAVVFLYSLVAVASLFDFVKLQ